MRVKVPYSVIGDGASGLYSVPWHVQSYKWEFYNGFSWLLVAIGLAVIVYSLLIYIARVDEVLLVVDKLRKKISAKYSA